MKPTRIQLAVFAVIGLFVVALFCSVLANAWGYWQIYGTGGWCDEVYALQGMVASQRALRDFREGHLRLYRMGGENKVDRFTGTNDGPFEVWVPHFYPSLGRAHRYSTEQFIAFYNRKMQYMFSHPERFKATNETVQLHPGADPNQPFRSR